MCTMVGGPVVAKTLHRELILQANISEQSILFHGIEDSLFMNTINQPKTYKHAEMFKKSKIRWMDPFV